MTDIVDIGSCHLDPDTNVLLAQCKSPPIGDTEDDAPDFGETPIACALGIVAIPYPKTDEGNAQGVIDESLPGTNGWITAMRDTRAASSKVIQQLGPGETAIHSTGPGFDSLVLLKNQLAAIMVGDDCAIVMDRKNKRFTVTCFGHHFELSEANGISATASGGATMQLKDTVAALTAAQTVLGGRTPLGAVQFGPLPVVGTGPGASAPAPGVFVGG